MTRILHKVFKLSLFVILLSCQRTEIQNNVTALEEVVLKERVQEPISPIAKRMPGISIANEPRTNNVFQYSSMIRHTIGEFVDAPMVGVNPKTVYYENHVSSEIKTAKTELPEMEVFPVMLKIIFDNDIFNNTDYYYTNGARIELVLPAAKQSPVNMVLMGLKGNDISISGFSITQNIYTPINPEANGIEYGDRPFAAYLTVGQFRESYHLKKRLQMKSALDIGVMGPLSMGEQVQSTVHTLEPTGWAYQVQNSFLINYYLSIEKGLYSSSNLELNVTGQANIGSLYNKLGGGFRFRTGSFLPVYRGPMTICCKQAKKRQLQYWFFMSINADLVAYDATLQGSMFSSNSPYVLENNEINRTVFTGSVGLALYYDNLGLELENNYLTPEFAGGKYFGYGRIKLVANF